MAYELIITLRASDDVESATAYYDAINTELGTRFLSEVSQTYKKLSADPQFYSFVGSKRKSNIRDVKLKSFPFVVIFEIRGKKVMIISVLNVHKKPIF
jgi:plasmid stabilization system protein ParE